LVEIYLNICYACKQKNDLNKSNCGCYHCNKCVDPYFPNRIFSMALSKIESLVKAKIANEIIQRCTKKHFLNFSKRRDLVIEANGRHIND
jgi:hypothetical protein